MTDNSNTQFSANTFHNELPVYYIIARKSVRHTKLQLMKKNLFTRKIVFNRKQNEI